MAPPMTLGQVRVVDPVLSTLARGYKNGRFGFEHLFPIVQVEQRAGKVITFGAEDFLQLDIERAPGGSRQRLNIGYAGDDYQCKQRALDGTLAIEREQEAQAVPNINLGRRTAMQTMKSVFLQVEIHAAGIATDSSIYSATHTAALAGSSQFDDDDSTPGKTIKQRREVIREAVGVNPNLLVVGTEVHDALEENPDVIDRVKYTKGPDANGNTPLITEELLAAYFGVEKYVVAHSRTGKPGAFTSLWGKNAILAYVNTSTVADAEGGEGEPSFGYTYRLRGYPVVSPPWFDRTCDSWIYPVTQEDTPVIAGADAGFLFTSVVA